MMFSRNARARGRATAILALLAGAAFSNSTAAAKDFKRPPRDGVIEAIEAPSRRSYEEIIVQLPPLVQRKAAATARAVTAPAQKSEPDTSNLAAAPPQATPPEAAAKAQDAPSATAPLEQAANETAAPKDANVAAPAEAKPASAPVVNGAEQSAPAPVLGPAPSEAASAPGAADAQTAPFAQSAPAQEKPAVILSEPPAAALAPPGGSAEASAAAVEGQVPQAIPESTPPTPLADADQAATAPLSGELAPSTDATDAADGGPAAAPGADAEHPAQGDGEHAANEGGGEGGRVLVGLASVAMTGVLALWLLRRKVGAKAAKPTVESPAVEASEGKAAAKAPIWARITAGLRARFNARGNGGAAQLARVKVAASGASNGRSESVASDASDEEKAAAKTPISTELVPRLTFSRSSAESGGSSVESAAPIAALEARAVEANANELERWFSGDADGLELLEPKQSRTSAIVANARKSLRSA